MPKINQRLLEAIIAKTGLSKPQVYKRIQQVTLADYLPPALAAIKVGADVGLAIGRYASTPELAELRQAGSPVTPPVANVSAESKPAKRMTKGSDGRAKGPAKKTKNHVFVVHGRDALAKDAMFAFLRSVGIKPIEWNSAIGMTKKPSPYVSEILNAAFSTARAVVVLLTPDDLAHLREDLLTSADPAFERRPTGQARPNVLFEAGMAFSTHPDKTVMVEIGKVRPFSDTAGRHVVHMTNDADKRKELVTKLENAGCDVDQTGTDWLSAGDFTDPEVRKPVRRARSAK